MTATAEAAFEEHIADWLTDHGGYQRVKRGNSRLPDFDPVVGCGHSGFVRVHCCDSE